MTRIGELTEQLELNPDASLPPFRVYLALPPQWDLLDTNPATWERSAQNLLDTTFHRARLSARERREVLAFFEQLVADCQQAGAALSMILVGRLSEGKAASLGIHLAFVEDEQPAGLGRVRESLPRTGTSQEVASGVGPAIMHSERTTMVPPGATELVAMTSIQIYVPIPRTKWTAVFATASAYPELTEPVRDLLTEMVAQFAADAEGDGTDRSDGADGGDSGAGDVSGEESTDAAAAPSGPEIGRGFGSLTRKTVPPPASDGSK